MIKKYLLILLLLPWSSFGLTQGLIEVNADNQPLNVVLLELRNQYNFQFSYSDNQLAKYKITVNKTFTSKDEAVNFLLKDYPFRVKKSNDVFIIIPDRKKEKKEQQRTKITGQVVEAGTFEPLPFSHILINNHQMISDVMGNFNYTASNENSFHVRISHLGYYVYDTIFSQAEHQKFTLIPSSENLPEITVKNKVIEKSTLIGERPGKIKLNHTISRFLPGQGDNSVFNLLRLMPGIQAAGEQSSDLLIWGSYEGQSQITFDEFTVFGLKNYNDNISVVNPFLVKNIEIFKGGYEAKYGNRVGGIVTIAGKNGNMLQPSFSININPTTINGLVEIPLFKKSSFMVAYRQTYYNLYNSDDFNIYAPTRPVPKSQHSGNSKIMAPLSFDLEVYPDEYRFRDINLKYTYQPTANDLFYISAYRGGDNFTLTTAATFSRNIRDRKGGKNEVPFEITLSNNEENYQEGLTAFYGKTWKNGNTSKLIVSHSKFNRQVVDNIESKNTENDRVYNADIAQIENTARENQLKIQHTIGLNRTNQLEMGVGLINNGASIETTTKLQNNQSIGNQNEFANNRMFAYLQNHLAIGSRLTLKSGARFNVFRGSNNYFFEPRLSASYQLNEYTKINTSWGIFNQFMYKVANIDRDANYSYIWLTTTDKIPALRARHSIAGINYYKNDFTINIEGYLKHTKNISERHSEINKEHKEEGAEYLLYTGNAKAYGIDTYIKKDFENNSIWASYTLSKTMQSLSLNRQPLPAFEPSPHDQRHEFKIAGLFNFRNFYLSGNYVYGSGMQLLKEVFEEENVAYNRFDVALTYRFQAKRFSGETGISILNVLDTQNFKHSNIKAIKISQDIASVNVYSDAVPFTPILFLKLVF